MIVLFYFLPSPIVPSHQREAYIQKRLASGNTVITALDYKPFEKASRSLCYDCTDALVHWRLVNSGRDVLVHMSDGDYGAINMTDGIRRARDWNQEGWKTRSDMKWVPYFSVPMTMDGIPGGSTDEEINMPWFQTVDQKLINYNMHNSRASLVVRAIVPEPGIVQIWRSATTDWALNSTAESQTRLDGDDGEHSTQRAAYDELMRYKQDTDFLASFHLVESWKNTLVVTEHLSGALSSRTYPMRRALLVPLGPFIAIPFIFTAALYDFVSPFVWLVAICMGILIGFVGNRKMLESGETPSLGALYWPLQLHKRWQRKKRRNKKRVWGPTGPVIAEGESSLFDEEREIGIRRPDTVRLGKS